MQGALAVAPLELGLYFVPHLRGYWSCCSHPGCTRQLHSLTWEGLVETGQKTQLGSQQDCHHGNFRDRGHLQLVVNPGSDSKSFLCLFL